MALAAPIPDGAGRALTPMALAAPDTSGAGRAMMPGGAGRAAMPSGAGRAMMPGGAGRALTPWRWRAMIPGGAGRAMMPGGAGRPILALAAPDPRWRWPRMIPGGAGRARSRWHGRACTRWRWPRLIPGGAGRDAASGAGGPRPFHGAGRGTPVAPAPRCQWRWPRHVPVAVLHLGVARSGPMIARPIRSNIVISATMAMRAGDLSIAALTGQCARLPNLGVATGLQARSSRRPLGMAFGADGVEACFANFHFAGVFVRWRRSRIESRGRSSRGGSP